MHISEGADNDKKDRQGAPPGVVLAWAGLMRRVGVAIENGPWRGGKHGLGAVVTLATP